MSEAERPVACMRSCVMAFSSRVMRNWRRKIRLEGGTKHIVLCGEGRYKRKMEKEAGSSESKMVMGKIVSVERFDEQMGVMVVRCLVNGPVARAALESMLRHPLRCDVEVTLSLPGKEM
jgi:hypothetical protein